MKRLHWYGRVARLKYSPFPLDQELFRAAYERRMGVVGRVIVLGMDQVSRIDGTMQLLLVLFVKWLER